MTRRGLGWKRSPPDTRDHVATEHRHFMAIQPPPPSFSNRHLILDVLDQGKLGSCVANAIAQAVRAAHIHEGLALPPFLARLALYYLARALTHDQHEDTGTYTRNGCAALSKFGFVPESLWPYDDNTTLGPNGEVPRFAQMPPARVFRAGFDQIALTGPASYMRITEVGPARLDVMKRAIASGYTIAFGTQVSEEFCSVEPGTAPIKPPIGAQIAGGHELLLFGYDSAGWDVCNSWSKDWNGNGFCRFSPDYLTWGETDDIWIFEALPAFSLLERQGEVNS